MKHALADIECLSPITDDRQVYNALLQAANESGATVLCPVQWSFYPQGFSAAVLLDEFHVCAHTYPDHFVIKVDCFASGRLNPEHLLRIFAGKISGELKNMRVIDRSFDAPRVS